jgi:endonuclease YncB( thermonuclease family)
MSAGFRAFYRVAVRPPSLLRVYRFAEELFVRDIPYGLVHCVSDSFGPQAKGRNLASGRGTVVRDGRTVLLTDSGEVRLAAIEVVRSSRDALQSPVDGRDLQLMRVGSDQARYGRVVAFVRVGDSQQAIQEILIAHGQARVEARIGDKACADILLRSERVARAARRGL